MDSRISRILHPREIEASRNPQPPVWIPFQPPIEGPRNLENRDPIVDSEFRSEGGLRKLKEHLIRGTTAMQTPSTSSRILGQTKRRVSNSTNQHWSDMQMYSFRTSLEFVPDGVVIVDKRGIITWTNRVAETILQYNHGELQGMSLDSIVPKRVRGIHHELVTNFFEKETKSRPIGKHGSIHGVRSDGSEVPLDIQLNASIGVPDDDGRDQRLCVAFLRELPKNDKSSESRDDKCVLALNSVCAAASLLVEQDKRQEKSNRSQTAVNILKSGADQLASSLGCMAKTKPRMETIDLAGFLGLLPIPTTLNDIDVSPRWTVTRDCPGMACDHRLRFLLAHALICVTEGGFVIKSAIVDFLGNKSGAQSEMTFKLSWSGPVSVPSTVLASHALPVSEDILHCDFGVDWRALATSMSVSVTYTASECVLAVPVISPSTSQETKMEFVSQLQVLSPNCEGIRRTSRILLICNRSVNQQIFRASLKDQGFICVSAACHASAAPSTGFDVALVDWQSDGASTSIQALRKRQVDLIVLHSPHALCDMRDVCKAKVDLHSIPIQMDELWFRLDELLRKLLNLTLVENVL